MVAVRSHVLGRPELSLARAVATAIDSVTAAYESGTDRRWGTFRVRMSVVLPASARSDAEHWQPQPDASLDDWARAGTYQGAIDAWRQAPARQHPVELAGHKAAVWSAAYSTAYTAVAMTVYQQQQNRIAQ